ncbi:O-antigen ligase [Mycobacterium sp. E1747]|uniref:O-antigen ligase family protein n=1 Tax=Mycobacterium sp. E1747 TaxID=1834128 RepID=UPI0007FE569B|nr:O-antigen ligase family protein [Mycobacterium sp. E1747]OBH04407.1 polymerase [Mycobacterium sp. E1747]
MIFYLRSRHRLAMSAASLALFLFGCFVFGVLSVRLTTEGLMLIAATFCLVVYWVRPEAMVWVALVGAFAALPQGLHVGKVVGPAVIYLYLLAAALAIGYLIPIVKPRFSDFWLPAVFLLVIVMSTAAGFENGHDATIVLRESLSMVEIAVGFVLAMLVVYGDYVKSSIRVTAGILWFSAGMAVVSSLHAIRLAGRAESLGAATGADQAVRIILTTQSPATATLSALVAAAIIGRLRPAMLLTLGPPALIISLLSFSRNTLISMAVAAGAAVLVSLSVSTVRRTVVITVICAAVVAATLPGLLFLLHGSQAGAWLGDQLTAFNERVLGGVSSSALAVDESALERLRENSLLNRSIAQAPVFGHGLGYAYQPPKGDDEFSAKFYPAYSHNFYLWWLAKAGAVGMTAFVLFALIPLVKAVRCRTAAAKVSVAVSAGLLAISVVWPLPEMPSDAFALGIALGAAMGFANLRDRERDANRAVSADTAALTAPSGAR